MVASIGSAAQYAEALFSKLDTKQQGYIDSDEIKSSLGSRATDADAAEVMKALDGDGNGQVSKSELSAAIEKVGSALSEQQDQSRVAAAGGAPGAGGPRGGGGGDRTSSPASETYDPADTNQDGTVSAAEQAAYALQQEVNQTYARSDPAGAAAAQAVTTTA
ncbi:EF-hand domain-containing protein [Massilia arenosa]|uniref:EF-hand domain-containing protein n=1 Tax=Zemynaea arenosa TaxID=2561931 RepID=A0A4Y9SZT3_9BURK|nr:EF-hand domain-containing protein [Massilia arenosa]TFW30256.1 EF-hand domain-containing protein [Massilia arenosa]